ncbi:MAG: hypothetical protein U0353_02210 [Sandaracinus sp.]
MTALQADGLSPAEQLAVCASKVGRMRVKRAMLTEILPELSTRGVKLLQVASLSAAGRAHLADYFHRQVMPVLTPLAIDPGHPFPHLRNKSLNLIAILSGTGSSPDAPAFAVVQVPQVLPRLVRVAPEEVGGTRAAYVLLDDLISRRT